VGSKILAMTHQVKPICAIVLLIFCILAFMGCNAEPRFPVRVLEDKDTTLVKRWPQRDLRQLSLGQRSSVMQGQIFVKGLNYDSLYLLGTNKQKKYSIANLKRYFQSRTLNIAKVKFISDSTILAYNRRNRIIVKWNISSDTLLQRYSFNPDRYEVGDLTSPGIMPFSLFGDTLIFNANEPITNSIESLRKFYSSGAQLGLMLLKDTSFKMITKFGIYPTQYQKSFLGASITYWDRLSPGKFLISYLHSPNMYVIDINNNIIDSARLRPQYNTLRVAYKKNGRAIVREMSSKLTNNNPTYYSLVKLKGDLYARLVNIPVESDSKSMELSTELLLYDSDYSLIDRIEISLKVSSMLVKDGHLYFLNNGDKELNIYKINTVQYDL
jgi:hypothetical protein